MNPYDKAHELARAIRASGEFQELKRTLEQAEQDQTGSKLLDRFRQLQMEYQQLQMKGEEPPRETVRELDDLLQKIGEKAELRRVLEAENRFGTLMGDINRIVTEPVEEFYKSRWKK
ncbi:YlbF family regulator [Paludifilum halophilum]|uniref:UPF0342 protein CHM34_06265 n=1 Tax=Paludifilum halophilum TaxID=1642702 RepID=A0A235B803_9BACL|nr:YlbF family regulator [Paludifilum halophilum]OYD08434.1 hypothetical protein CHM34_06265 [Paludifilum halophilum]